MTERAPNPSLRPRELISAWGRILTGHVPMLSIEITRECPLSCPGCYAYGDSHLGGEIRLHDLADYRGGALVEGILQLVRKHRPLHVSLVGGEPLLRHRELDEVLPALGKMDVFTLVVTSGVIRIPPRWMKIPRLRVAVSVDGLPEHHDVRREPATYARILRNIEGCEINVHWVITRPMLSQLDYLERYVAFWSERPEVNRIWVSVYTPQVGEESPEILTREDRMTLARSLPAIAARYPKLLTHEGIGRAIVRPPQSPGDCLFAKMSANYSADLSTRVEPCVFGGTPDCSQCGCAISSGLHWIRSIPIAGPLKIDHIIGNSIRMGKLANKFRSRSAGLSRWGSGGSAAHNNSGLVQLGR